MEECEGMTNTTPNFSLFNPLPLLLLLLVLLFLLILALMQMSEATASQGAWACL